MTRVLLVCPEPLGHRQPAGIGVRFLEMARVLRGDGHDVTVMSPDAGLVEGCRSAAFTPLVIQDETARAEVAVVQGHAANDVFAHGRPIPTVVDLYDPFIVENLHYYRERGAEVFLHDHATLINSIVRGDYFLCASEAQRLFYAGMFIATGRANPALFDSDPSLESLIGIAPFGVNAPNDHDATSQRGAILFGGIYDWYDPILAIEATAIARRTIPNLTITFTLHPNPEITPQGKAREAIEYTVKQNYDAFVRFDPWVPYSDRGLFFERFELALLTFPQSLETDLSMRTRVYDYLWGNLPVISNSAPGTDEILRRYAAGSVVSSERAEDVAAEIVAISGDDARRDQLVAGARRFVHDHQWPDVLQPLRAFCRRPRVEITKEGFAMRLRVPEQRRSILGRLKRRIGGAF